MFEAHITVMDGEMLAYFHGNRVPKPLIFSKNS